MKNLKRTLFLLLFACTALVVMSHVDTGKPQLLKPPTELEEDCLNLGSGCDGLPDF